MLAESLRALEAWLGEHAPETLASLAPGVTSPPVASPDLATLYAWRAGQIPQPKGTKKPLPRPVVFDGEGGYELLGPELAAEHKAKLDKKLAKGGFDNENYVKKNAWHARWVPFAFAKPVYLVVDLEGCFAGGVPGQIVRVDLDSAIRMILAPSLAAFFAHQEHLRATGAIEVHPKHRVLRAAGTFTAHPEYPAFPIKKHVDQVVRPRVVPAATKLLDVLKQRMSASEVEAAIAEGARLDAQDVTGLTPLHLAAQGPSTAPLEAMLRAGGVVDQRDRSGCTPLVHAITQNVTRAAVAMVRVLLAAGADLDAADTSGTTPRTYVERRFDVASRDAMRALIAERDKP